MCFRGKSVKLSASIIIFLIIASALFIAYLLFPQGLIQYFPSFIIKAKHLELVAEKDITPPGEPGVRPDAVAAGNFFYVNYLQKETIESGGMKGLAYQKFRIIKLDESLNILSVVEACPDGDDSGKGNCPLQPKVNVRTDSRMAINDEGIIWNPFETAIVNPNAKSEEANFLNFAVYNTKDSALLEKVIYQPQIAANISWTPETVGVFPIGSDYMDDPAPFIYNNVFYILNRTYQTAQLHVRYFYPPDFKQAGDYFLDFSRFAEDETERTLSVNTPIIIEDNVYLITGFFKAASLPGVTGDIVAFRLNSDLRTVEEKITLSHTDSYEQYVSGARYADGKLYIAYNKFGFDGSNTGKLKVFDVQNNFQLLEDIDINSGSASRMIDNHMTVELMGGKIFVFFNDENMRLHAKIFEWK